MRLGTPAATTRGMGVEEMRQIGRMIARLAKEGDAAVAPVKQQVLELCARFPLYPEV